MAKRPLYNELAWAYDLIVEKPSEVWAGFIDRALREAGVPADGRVLDAGCGTGEYASRLGRQGYNICGVDLSREMIAQAKAKCEMCEGAVEFVEGNLLDLPKMVLCDAVICRGVLNDLTLDSDRQRVFPSFASVLKPNGVLILDVRDWEASVRRKAAKPIIEKRFVTDRGELFWRSRTGFDERRHGLLIRETSELVTSNDTLRTSYDLVMRCWTMGELTHTLSAAKFSIVRLLGGYGRDIVLGTTDRIVAVARLTGGD